MEDKKRQTRLAAVGEEEAAGGRAGHVDVPFFSFAGWKLRGEHTRRGMGFERERGGDCGFVPLGEGERYRDGEQRVLMGRGCIALEHLGWHEDVVKASIQ